ncbi:MAG: hypothetical protein R3C49_14570 [Planctomycetaceae bacterium]
MQKLTMKCEDARHLVHLSAGNDTFPDEEHLLSEHLHQCSDCRAYHAGMVRAMSVLEQVRDRQPVERPTGSVWAGISGQLKNRRTPERYEPPRRHFNVAVATLCACSLMLAIVTAVRSLPGNDADGWNNQNLMPAMHVGFSPGSAAGPSVRNVSSSGSSVQRPQLIPFKGPSGEILYIDQATGQAWVPNLIPQARQGERLDF